MVALRDVAAPKKFSGTIIDGRGHLLGRLASMVAKELLSGKTVCVVRCEELSISGGHIRNKGFILKYFHKRHLTNPKRGAFHYRQPSKMFWKVVRGMMRYKTKRGSEAMNRLSVYDGIPAPFDKMKRFVAPGALVNLRLNKNRKRSNLGKLASELGWKYGDVLARQEDKRKASSMAYYKEKKVRLAALSKAKKVVTSKLSKKHQDILAKFGY